MLYIMLNFFHVFFFLSFFMQIVIKSNKVTPAALASLQDILLLLCNDIERNPGPSKDATESANGRMCVCVINVYTYMST